jgi:CBS domain-containing protein
MRIDSLHAAISARLVVVGLEATLRTAALCLSRPGIGLVIVSSDTGAAAGVLTKSDLVRHLTRAGEAEAPVLQLMTRPVLSCEPGDDLYKAWQLMTKRKLQNMPVLGPDLKPVGTLDIRDAMQALFEEERYQEHVLIDYISGVGYR